MRLLALPVGALLFVQLAMILRPRDAAVPPPPPGGSAESLGTLLFTDYLFPFELTSVLLLAAMVGVLVLARRRPS